MRDAHCTMIFLDGDNKASESFESNRIVLGGIIGGDSTHDAIFDMIIEGVL